MTDSISTSAFDAVESDGFVDYYRLLDLAPDTPGDNVQARIAELYNDAQANRDHRNMSKRQQYQLMLELLPQARTILSDDERRAQYDEYLARHRAGETAGDHEAFLRELAAEDTTEQTDDSAILGVKKAPEAPPPHRKPIIEPRASVTKIPSQPEARRATPENAPAFASVGESVRGSFISMLVFFVFLIVFYLFVVPGDLAISSLVAAAAGLIAWWLTHFRKRDKTSV